MGREGHTACAGPAGPVPVLRAARDAADEIARAPDLRRVRRRSLCASGLALIEEQIELGRTFTETCQDHVSVTAVMGLMVEPVIQRGHQLLHEFVGSRDTAVVNDAGEPRLVEAVDPGYDTVVLGFARNPQVFEVSVHDRVEPFRRLALAGEPLHPDIVGRQQVIERAVHRLEECAAIGTVIGIA